MINQNRIEKSQFLFFLNDLKMGRVQPGRGGWNGWVDRYAHLGEWMYLQDYLEAITNAAIGQGHGKSYYTGRYPLARGITMGHTTEAMANYTALLGVDAARAEVYRKLLMLALPNSTRKFGDLFEEMSKAERMPDDFSPSN